MLRRMRPKTFKAYLRTQIKLAKAAVKAAEKEMRRQEKLSGCADDLTIYRTYETVQAQITLEETLKAYDPYLK